MRLSDTFNRSTHFPSPYLQPDGSQCKAKVKPSIGKATIKGKAKLKGKAEPKGKANVQGKADGQGQAQPQ